MNPSIYLDYSATTPVDPKVLEVMMPYFQTHFGNATSTQHSFGWAAEAAVENARKQVAETLNCSPAEIIFTSGATESNNWAVFGLIEKLRLDNPNEKIHLLTTAVEHNSVLKPFEHAVKVFNVEVDTIPVDKNGKIEAEKVLALIKPHTKLVSIMWVNNELGNIYPLQEILQVCKAKQIYFHTDATQAIGKIKIDLEKLPVDMLSFSGHKIYGPKGSGILYLRNRNPKVQILPFMVGGSHEKGQRAGTVNVPAVVGLGMACELIQKNLEHDSQKSLKTRQSFLKQISDKGLRYKINGDESSHIPNVLNITFLTAPNGWQTPGLAISQGSACHSGKINPSHVLKAIGLTDTEAEQTIRISLSHMTTESEIKSTVDILAKSIEGTKVENKNGLNP